MDEIHYAEFENPNFDAKKLVQKYRLTIPLPQLQKSLHAHHATTRQELVELINEKCSDFVSLSSGMQGVERALKPLRAPLEVARDSRRIKLNLGGSVCLPPPPPPPPAEGGKADSSGGDQGEAFPEGQALLAEAESFQQTFAARLQERLRALVTAAQRCWEEAPPPSAGSGTTAPALPPRSEMLAIAHTCRALCIIGQSASVETIFTAVFVKNVLQKATVACNNAAEEAKKKAMSETTQGGARVVGAGAVDLGVFFETSREALISEGTAMLWLTRQLRGEADDGALLAVPSLFLVSNAVVLPVLQHVQEVWPNVFMPAFPDTFAANFGHFTEFLKAAEAFMPENEQQALARAQGLADFQRRWKTQVYCSLRAKEASQKLEAAAKRLQSGSVESLKRHEAGGHGYRLEVSAEVVKLLETVWSRWYLSSLYPKMVRLCLELLARYGKCIKDLAEEAPASGPGWDSSAASPTWAASSLPVRLCQAASDLLQVLSELEASERTGHLAGVFLERLPVKDGKPAELARALLKEASEGLRPTVQALKDSMLKQVVAVMAPQFAPIRNIPAFYRMLNKPVPTKASTYVEAALRPLQAFREVIAEAAIQSPKVVEEWLREAVDGAASEFTVQATQLLESTAQQEASLRRLAGRGAGGEAQVSDLDKIHMQLCLDVDTFSAAASALGPDVGSAPGLAKLAQAVAAVRPAPSSQ
eukprot:TRINITY_DN6886_c0_g1_i3.p1 TRINITY_DN6886_c0_g1~~TRINITY_DN6886_c0_g1_i3.p1  ORF type:complete len:703 (+),score=193.70 TRINITY_DN6886_c0_g1_i3:141-2249(+)